MFLIQAPFIAVAFNDISKRRTDTFYSFTSLMGSILIISVFGWMTAAMFGLVCCF